MKSKVGKQIGSCLYVHATAAKVLPEQALFDAIWAVILSKNSLFFDYIKYNSKTGAFTFVQCMGWDELAEPSLVRSVRASVDGKVTVRDYGVGNPPIIHGKHLFVLENYDGFDYQEAKERWDSYQKAEWLDKKRMGFLQYWSHYCIPMLRKQGYMKPVDLEQFKR